jgi:hypothetical protein
LMLRHRHAENNTKRKRPARLEDWWHCRHIVATLIQNNNIKPRSVVSRETKTALGLP